MKIFLCLLLLTACSPKSHPKQIAPSLYKEKTLKELKGRPDLTVLMLESKKSLTAKEYVIYLHNLVKIGKYQKAIAYAPNKKSYKFTFHQRGKIYLSLAHAYAGIADFPQAHYYFNKTLSRNNPYYFYQYAKFELFLGNTNQSLILLEKALKIKEKSYIKRLHQQIQKNKRF